MCDSFVLHGGSNRFIVDALGERNIVRFSRHGFGRDWFQVLSRSVTGGSASGIYESVVLIDSSLSGCASKFNSITFFDDEAMENPGSVWEYALRTKYSESKTLDQISDSVTVTIPWRGILEGSIFIGGNANVPMRNVRVCAKLSSGISQTQHALSSGNLASFMMVVHSNPSKVARVPNNGWFCRHVRDFIAR